MASRQHVIELNGKRYDARTGKVVSEGSTKAAPKASVTTAKPKLLDGFVRRKTQSSGTAKKVHRKPEHSKTLMRSLVKKPVAVKPAQKAVKQVAPEIRTPHLAQTVKPERALHASLVHKSKLVSKFGKNFGSHIKTDILPVKNVPKEQSLERTAAALARPAAKTIVANPFDDALEHATSHEQPKLKKAPLHHKIARKLHISPRTLIITSSSLVLLIVASFWAYINVPNVAVRVASLRAGVAASVPTYQPAGFALKGPISYQPGQVTMNYKSNSDDRDFAVIQRASDWNSETLLDNFVSTKNQEYQTVQANGRTIYMYDDGNATWVDGGTWYQVLGKSTLSSDQLLRIANGL